MFLALEAYLRVCVVSSYADCSGEMQATMIVLELPPRDSLRSLVNFESLNGIYLDLFSERDWITMPRASRDQLIFFASSRRLPIVLVLLTLSLPARSTRYKVLLVKVLSVP